MCFVGCCFGSSWFGWVRRCRTLSAQSSTPTLRLALAFATIRARCVLGGAPRSRREPRCCCGCACWVLGALHGEPPQLPNGSRRERGGHHQRGHLGIICVRADARAIGNGRVWQRVKYSGWRPRPPPCQSRKPEKVLFSVLVFQASSGN